MAADTQFREGDVVLCSDGDEGVVTADKDCDGDPVVAWTSGISKNHTVPVARTSCTLLRRPVRVGDVLLWRNGYSLSGDRIVSGIEPDGTLLASNNSQIIMHGSQFDWYCKEGHLTHKDGTLIGSFSASSSTALSTTTLGAESLLNEERKHRMRLADRCGDLERELVDATNHIGRLSREIDKLRGIKR